MTPTYEDVCKAFKAGWWSADAVSRRIRIDGNLSSLLCISSNEYTFEELLEHIVLTDKEALESILTRHTAYPLTNWNITLDLHGTTYHLELIFELPSEEHKKSGILNGYARVSEISDKKLLILNPIKVGTPYCTVHNNIQTELQDNNVRLLGVCKIGIIRPWTWCLKRGRIELMSVAENNLRNEEFGLDEFINAIHPQDRDVFIEQKDKILDNTSSLLTCRFRSRFLTKTYKWYEISASVIECHSGDKRSRCVGILHDIDDKKKNEEALNQSDNLLKSIYDNIPVGIELYDKDGLLADTNNKDLEIFGVSKDADLRHINLFDDPSIPYFFKKNLKEGLQTEAFIDYDIDKTTSLYKSSLNGVIHLLTRGTPLFNNRNEVINYLLVHYDQTESVASSNRIKDFELFFSAIAEYSKIGYCKWDMIAKKGFAIDQWFLNLGEEPHGDIENIIHNYSHLHPEDQLLLEKARHEMLSGVTKNLKHEIRVKNGDSWKWIYSSVVVTKYEPWNGNLETASINIDISKYKELELGLTETAHKAEALVQERDLVIENLSSGLIHIDSDFIVQWKTTDAINPVFSKTNYIPGKVCYRSVYDRETPCPDCALEKMLKTGERTTIFREENGLTMEINANPVYNKNGTISSGVLQVIDITTRREQERKIDELNQLMGAILNNIPVNIYVKNPADDFRYLYWNEELFHIYGFKGNDVIGKKDSDLFPAKVAEARIKSNKEQIKNNVEKVFSELVIYDKAGEERIVNSTQILIKRDDNTPLIIGVAWDITELKRYEKELLEAKNVAEESNRIKSAFLANMSHEIRTPLNAIVGFSELITDSNIGIKEKNEFTGIIRRNSQLLLQLISDILDLSKIEAHVLELNYETISLKVLCNRIAMTSNTHNEAKVPIIFDNDLPDYIVRTDENRLQQIIVNFLNNAIKFTYEGAITIGYTLLKDDEIEIYVQDTGVGIPQDKLAAIFDRFVKLDSFVQGTGLGLSICRSIIELLNGCIGVESEEGKGARFWVTIPYDKDLKIE